MNRFSIGIDLGGTRVKLGLLKDNIILERNIFKIDSGTGLQANLHDLEIVIDRLLKKYDVEPVYLQGIGLAFPGLVDPVSKKIISTNKKYDDGPTLELKDWVKNKWDTSFYIDNDTRMATVGEWKFGAAKGTNDLVVVTIGTGIGSS